MEKPKQLQFDVEGFPTAVKQEDFGRGRLHIVQVAPPGFQDETTARRQIHIRGFTPRSEPELPKLIRDLRILADANLRLGTPMITTGVVFTGDRNFSRKFVGDGLPPGVRVTEHFYEMAEDLRDGVGPEIHGTNAEFIGYSGGGPLAQVAHHIGLRADMIGLVNTAGLIDLKKRIQVAGAIGRQWGKSLSERVADRVRGIEEQKGVDVALQDDILTVLAVGHNANPSRRQKLADLRSMRYAWTPDLIAAAPDTLHVVGSSRADTLFPAGLMREHVGQKENVVFHTLPWRGHTVDGNRSGRLAAIAGMMQEARK